MYIAMNRFKIKLGSEEDFINIWRSRETHLDSVPGFESFNLLQGNSNETHTLFASHTVWNTEESFIGWTQSEQFRKAHANAGGSKKDLYLGPPQFEGFNSLLCNKTERK